MRVLHKPLVGVSLGWASTAAVYRHFMGVHMSGGVFYHRVLDARRSSRRADNYGYHSTGQILYGCHGQRGLGSLPRMINRQYSEHKYTAIRQSSKMGTAYLSVVCYAHHLVRMIVAAPTHAARGTMLMLLPWGVWRVLPMILILLLLLLLCMW